MKKHSALLLAIGTTGLIATSALFQEELAYFLAEARPLYRDGKVVGNTEEVFVPPETENEHSAASGTTMTNTGAVTPDPEPQQSTGSVATNTGTVVTASTGATVESETGSGTIQETSTNTGTVVSTSSGTNVASETGSGTVATTESGAIQTGTGTTAMETGTGTVTGTGAVVPTEPEIGIERPAPLPEPPLPKKSGIFNMLTLSIIGGVVLLGGGIGLLLFIRKRKKGVSEDIPVVKAKVPKTVKKNKGTRLEDVLAEMKAVEESANEKPEDEPKSEPQTEPVAEAAPEGAPAPVATIDPEVTTDTVPDTIAEATPASKVDAVPEAVAEPVAETVPMPVAENSVAPEPKAETTPEPVVETVPEQVIQDAPEPEVAIETEELSDLEKPSKPILPPLKAKQTEPTSEPTALEKALSEDQPSPPADENTTA